MASDKKSKILRRTIATTTAVATVVLQTGGAGATTVISDSQENQSQDTAVINEVQEQIIEIESSYPGVPYFYYWTSGDDVYLNWDYGHVANRPSKIEAVIDSNQAFSDPSYIEVKPKGATFVPNIEGDFYLRVRFFDSSGDITHESIRKVIRNSTETRDIKGLKYEAAGTGVKLSWANFVDGIRSAKIFVDGKLYKDLVASDVKDNSYVVENVSEGSEIRISIINGNGLEYNGVVNIKEGTLQKASLIGLGLSSDGVGIEVDLSNTNFKKGNEFTVDINEKDGNAPIVSNFKVTLDQDGGSFVVYPNEGLSFMDTDYIVKITDVKTGDVYTYDYSHGIFALPSFVSASNGGEIVVAWDALDNIAGSELIWSTSEDFSSYQTISVNNGESGVLFDSGLKDGNVYLILTTYDDKGRVFSQNYGAVKVSQAYSSIDNLKGVYKDDNVVEFSWDKINTDIYEGIIKVNDTIIPLSNSQLSILNSVNTLTLGGFEKGNQYDVSLYLLDKDKNVYTSSISSLQESPDNSETSGVTIVAPNGVSALYTLNPGTLSLLLNQNIFKVSTNSPIGITIDGRNVSSVSGVYVNETNGINITGLIPEKEYKNIEVSYKDENGEVKSIKIDSLLIKKGSALDSFLINSYNKALSRSTNNIDEEGYNYWKRSLLNKTIGLSYFIRNLAYVPEFMGLVNSPQDLVTRLYQVLVLRDPEPQGLQFWTNVYNELIANGVSHVESTMKILTDMTTSTEFSNLAERLGVNP